MDIIYDLFAIRNVNRPYTEHELKEICSKEQTTPDENKRSRLSRCVSFDDVNEDEDDTSTVKDTETVATETQEIKNEPTLNSQDEDSHTS